MKRQRGEKMESGVPRWQEGSALALCQAEGGREGGMREERKGQRVIDAGERPPLDHG